MPRIRSTSLEPFLPPEAISAFPFLARAENVRSLPGGRTSTVLLVSLGDERSQIVVKLAREDLANPLFQNKPHDEWAALCALSRHGVAPMPVGMHPLQDGTVLILYQYLSGNSGVPTAPDLARVLKRLHRIAPLKRFPIRPHAPDALLQEAEAMLADTVLPPWATSLRPTCLPTVHPFQPCLVHRDPIASNTVSTVSGDLVLIDWQCPAIGDPVEDIAHATSPAMAVVYGAEPVTPETLLMAYDDDQTARRATQLLPFYRWRMLCYCNWKAHQGDDAYAAAMEHEAADLEQMQADAHRKG
ncbi:phosphotransferase [Tropicimonas sp. S265A]|uniref:phosphotransferase n=1 Tax=Tropicimonas sp. S265A TaxID=3415134 RepID=UPI003C7A9254